MSGVRTICWSGIVATVFLAQATLAPAQDAPSAYPFAEPPLAIYDRLSSLKVGEVPALPEFERQVLRDAWASRTAKKPDRVPAHLLLDALLAAAGVDDADKRQEYRERFEKLVADAKLAVGEAKGVRDRGEKLMGFLHAGVMKKGYDEGQSSFTAVLDSGKFNCVSSSAVYYAVGSRLGLELRPISIPGDVVAGHAALDLIDGKDRVQVEPTNPDGFDWQAKVSRPGVRVIGFIPDRKKGHEVDALGLPAMIYSNRGVGLTKAKDTSPLAAARCYLAALALDPNDPTAANNLKAVFVNWGPELADQKKYEEGLRVLALGRAIAPKDARMRDNSAYVWEKYLQWLLDEKRDKDAVAAAAEARKALPDHASFQEADALFRRQAGKHVESKDYEGALAVVERGLAALPPEDANKLRAWRSEVFRWWSQALLKQKDVDQSLKVLARAYKLAPDDREVHAGIGFHLQESLKVIEEKDGRERMAAHFKNVRTEFPKVDDVAQFGKSHAGRAVQSLVEKKKFAEAVAAVKDYAPLLVTDADRAAVGAMAYDRWARHLADSKEFAAALEKYAEGLKAYPGHAGLQRNLGATVDQWAESAVQKKDWAEAARIYRVGLTYLPDDARLKNNAEVYERKK
jgi:tetratricopeptide (TPR) repeat protein